MPHLRLLLQLAGTEGQRMRELAIVEVDFELGVALCLPKSAYGLYGLHQVDFGQHIQEAFDLRHHDVHAYGCIDIILDL